jgi:hypothetical protein
MGHALNSTAACDMAKSLALEKSGLGDGAKVVDMRRKTWNSYDLAIVIEGVNGVRKDVYVTDTELKRSLAASINV